MLKNLQFPVIFAHRGASAYAPENTIAAFELAIRQGADAIELDTKLTADKKVVVIHDQTLDRTTSKSGRVGDYNLSDIRNLDAGSHFDIAFKGEKVPTLEDVLNSVGEATFTNIELANYASPNDDLPYATAEIVKKMGLHHRVMFSSFNPLALIRARKILPQTPVGLLALYGKPGWLARSWLGRFFRYQSIHPEHRDVTPQLVNTSHQKGKYVFVYTVNQEEEMRRLFKLKVDGIFTDDPVLALQVRDSFVNNFE